MYNFVSSKSFLFHLLSLFSDDINENPNTLKYEWKCHTSVLGSPNFHDDGSLITRVVYVIRLLQWRHCEKQVNHMPVHTEKEVR